MNKAKDKKQKASLQTNQLKVFLFGDDEEKNKDFIRMYANKADIVERSDSFEFDKVINDKTYKTLIYFVSIIDDKIITMIRNSNAVFILFDMSDRSSFDNILDKWLIWIRDSCGCKENIFLFGDYKQCEKNKGNLFLVTSEDEIQEVIDCAEINGNFCKIGGVDDNIKRQKIDDQIIIAAKTIGKKQEIPEDEGGSFKKDTCNVF